MVALSTKTTSQNNGLNREEKTIIEYSTTSCINTVSIRELGPDEPARTLFGMTYDVQLTTSGRN